MPQKRKDQMERIFSGFALPATNAFSLPLEFMDILAGITNIAELKIIIYIIRHTWSARQYGVERWITVDEFMFGVKEYQGDGTFTRVDHGTQLCERSVVTGVQKALDAGYVECHIDDHDRGRVRKYYRLKLRDDTVCTPEVQTLHPSAQYSPSSIVSPGVQTLHPSKREKKASFIDESNNVSPGEQIVPPQGQVLQTTDAKDAPRTYSSSNSNIPVGEKQQEVVASKFEFEGSTDHLIKKRKNIPTFLRSYAEDFSRKFHDVDHTYSNLKQMSNIFEQSGLGQEDFINCLYEAAEITMKAVVEKRSGQYPNRMPYFFRCVRESVEEQCVFLQQGDA